MALDTSKNGYTLAFAAVLVVVVGALLSVAAISLKPFQQKNANLEKMQNILRAVNVSVPRKEAGKFYKRYVKQALVIDDKGNVVKDPKVPAFQVDLATELKKQPDRQEFPIFVSQKDGKTYYIIPLRGHGLWGPIWGYVSLKGDLNTIYGITFGHASETPGLGAEITQQYFQSQFKSEKIFDDKGQFRAVTVIKGYADPNNDKKDDGEVDALAGATITSNGVTAMMHERLKRYIPYFKKLKMGNHV